MICSYCNAEFVPPHFNSKCCSDECRLLSRRRSRDKYKKSEKGLASKKRWVASERRKENERGYREKPRARALAVIRSTKALARSSELQAKKKARDRAFAITDKGRAINKVASQKYRNTEKGKITQINGKARRRAVEKNGRITAKEWAEKLKEYNYVCASCGADENIEMDHIIPLSKGGRHHIDNIQPLCRSCNASKGASLDWVNYC